ncbi:hypothetical protein UA08_01963 [Talaromyces atroroseus]|uniref:Methyltransferase type 11 domain-containing protein n=1 Tax=Talaromyces atroroseus TaxID=1441469 RepID=A0A1Q5QBZ8_TALAT|nr:hypothetical protein UA08_01963 [Talaromyces atroroseus]OKL63477.1 hypothetical protein UA08_01963 [Talaromyces atroroseus]
MSQALHHIAQTGFSDASAYDKHRPTYTAHETELILTRTLSSPGEGNRKVVDLAAGTGLFTEALVAARPKEEGEAGFYEIVAVEPHDDMRKELENKALPGVKVVKGWASELPMESGSVDVVFATQAFHWFANLESLREIRRVLKPNGYLALIWHVDAWNGYRNDPVPSDWEGVIKTHIWLNDDNVPRFRHGKWKDVFDEKEQTYFETPLQEEKEYNTQWLSVEEFKEKFDKALNDAPRNEAGEECCRQQLGLGSGAHASLLTPTTPITSTEGKYKRGIYRGLKISISLYVMLWMLHLIKTGVHQEEIEHKWPTPPEWGWKSRWDLRSATALQHPEDIGQVTVQWQNVYGYLKDLLERLEDPKSEGQGIKDQADGGILIDGVGKVGYDVSMKSEPWRRGYFQCLMDSAKAAENLDGYMTDWKQRVTAQAEYVHGPSNPNAKTLPGRTNIVMREEDCTPSAPPPEVFYMKILTTTGFTARQKIDAALAYADWLNYKGLGSTAREMYSWAMDIATSGELPYDASSVVDTKTGILKNNGKDIASENIMRVSTALGVHNVKAGDLTTALSIFTSVLKARRSLPEQATSQKENRPVDSRGRVPFDDLFEKVRIMFVPPVYPEAPPDGNQPPVRSIGSPCEEAGLMTYIGEILYASSSKENGLAWTRDAVDIAELALLDLNSGGHNNRNEAEPRGRCSQCLKVSLGNWRTMVSNLVSEAVQAERAALAEDKAWYQFSGSVKKAAEKKTMERKRWQAEQMIIEDRANRLLRLTNDYTLYQPSGFGTSMF